MEKRAELKDYRSVLVDEFTKRQERRPRYSLRAFARDIGVKAATLSDVLKGRYGLSPAKASEIAEKLGFNAEQASYFSDLVAQKHARSSAAREAAARRIQAQLKDIEFKYLRESERVALSSWEFPAVRQFIRLKKGHVTLDGLATALQLSTQKISAVVRTLSDLRLLSRDGERFDVADANLRSESPLPSATIRSFHKSILKAAAERIETEPIERRKFQSTVLTVDSNRIAEARAWLEQMNQEFINKFQNEETATDVYAFSLQFFRLNTGETNEVRF